MNKLLAVGMCLLCLIGCSAVKVPLSNEYQISAYSMQKIAKHPGSLTLKVTQPEAVSAFSTAQMHYMKRPYQLESFAKNEWVEPPASMLYPVLVQTMQQTGYFHAVLSSPYAQGADYRLDSQLLDLTQIFMHKPSVLRLSMKVSLTRVSDSKVIASTIFTKNSPCPQESPYGGVLAANQASLQLTREISNFVIFHIKSDRRIARK